MPIKISTDLPAYKTLLDENIFVMPDNIAEHQDIRALRIAILNLMPKKIETETQFLRLLSNTPLQVDVDFVHVESHVSKNTSVSHLNTFYKTFRDIKDNRYDGLIITGAPVEHLEYEDVDYWDEVCEIMEWSKTNVYSTMHICWGAMAGLSTICLVSVLCSQFLALVKLCSQLHHHLQIQNSWNSRSRSAAALHSGFTLWK